MNKAHQSRFLSEQGKRTRWYGVFTAIAAFLVLPFFYYTDQNELGIEGTLLWRGLGFLGAAFFLGSLLFKPTPKQVIIFHGVTLLTYLIMMLGISTFVFINPSYGMEQLFAVTTGTLTVLAINTLVAQGSRSIVMWGTGVLTIVFTILVLSNDIVNAGWPVSILILCVFSILVLRAQNRQEKEKATYLYTLEEKEARIARQREELEDVNANLVGFNFAITHDLKGALRRAQSFAQLIERRLSPEVKEGVHDLFDLIKQNHDKIQEIIDGLTLLNRIGKTDLERYDVAVSQVVERVWDELSADLKEGTEVEFRNELTGQISGDEGLIWHVFNNLLSNAVKYSQKKERPVIEVGGFRDRDEKIIFVKDNGAGFPQKFAQDLGRPFKRLHSAHDFEGTGIGLAIVKQIVELHGGRFWGEGEEGKGATFYFSLPADKRD
ncbi:MAG: ATP-binding protein [Phaeodactylibacter sp.]|uniref:ATP-binding protein n=1 Tax=Phaeodactylibacter sp. TaxID=1940289 RepID=UPI0032ED395E